MESYKHLPETVYGLFPGGIPDISLSAVSGALAQAAPAGRSLFPLAAVAAAASAAAAALFAFCRPDGIDRPSGQRQKNEDRKRFHKGFLSAAEAALRSSVLLRREMARFGAVFGAPQYSTDNAMGVAVLGRMLEGMQ